MSYRLSVSFISKKRTVVAFDETLASATRISSLYSFASVITGTILGLVVRYVRYLKPLYVSTVQYRFGVLNADLASSLESACSSSLLACSYASEVARGPVATPLSSGRRLFLVSLEGKAPGHTYMVASIDAALPAYLLTPRKRVYRRIRSTNVSHNSNERLLLSDSPPDMAAVTALYLASYGSSNICLLDLICLVQIFHRKCIRWNTVRR